MEAFCNLLGKSASDSPDQPLLSELVRVRGGYLLHQDVQLLNATAKELRAKEEWTKGERMWIADFVDSIADVIRQDTLTEQQVNERVSDANDRRANTCTTFVDARQDALEQAPGVSGAQPSEEVQPVPAASSVGGVRPQSLPSRRDLPLPPIKMNELVQRPEMFEGKKKDARR